MSPPPFSQGAPPEGVALALAPPREMSQQNSASGSTERGIPRVHTTAASLDGAERHSSASGTTERGSPRAHSTAAHHARSRRQAGSLLVLQTATPGSHAPPLVRCSGSSEWRELSELLPQMLLDVVETLTAPIRLSRIRWFRYITPVTLAHAHSANARYLTNGAWITIHLQRILHTRLWRRLQLLGTYPLSRERQ